MLILKDISSAVMSTHAENGHAPRELTTQDMFIKDAFLIFRSLCKLTMKPLNTERYALCVNY